MVEKRLELPSLPYDYAALEPVIPKRIVELHHDKHQAAYINNTNIDLEKLEKLRTGQTDIDLKGTLKDLSFNFNGAILHEIYWKNMRSPKENNQPAEGISQSIGENFGSFDNFKAEFSKASNTVEGSGWGVLWMGPDKSLIIGQLEVHNHLGLNGYVPLLVLDVWEHAYYLQYENNRANYVENWWQVVNWEDVERRFQK